MSNNREEGQENWKIYNRSSVKNCRGKCKRKLELQGTLVQTVKLFPIAEMGEGSKLAPTTWI